jgi:hypothetical protein
MAMQIEQKEVLKQKIWVGAASVVGGFVACAIIFGGVLGWESPLAAKQQASDASQTAVAKVLAPYCANAFLTNKTAVVAFEKAQKQGYGRSDVVQKTLPKLDGVSMGDTMSSSCVGAITARLKEAAKSTPAATPTKS